MRGAAILLTFVLLWKTLRLDAGPLPATALGLLLLVISFERLALRPELFSVMLAAAFLFVLERARAMGWDRRIWILVPLYVVWVNLHGYHLVGLILVLAYLVGGEIERGAVRYLKRAPSGSRVPRWAWALVPALVLCACINPGGPKGALYPLAMLRGLAGESGFMLRAVAEFQSPLSDPTGAIHIRLFEIAAILGLGSSVLAFRRLSPSQLLVFLIFLVQALGMRRNLPFFAVAAGPLLARNLGRIGGWVAVRVRNETALRRVAGRVAAVVVVAAALFVSWATLSDRFYLAVGGPQRSGFGFSRLTYPKGAVDFLLSSHAQGEVFNTMDAGGYFLWRAYPEKLPFIMGDTNGYDPEFLLRYFDIIRGRTDFNAVAGEYGIGCALLDHTQEYANALISRLARDPAWVLTWLDGTAMVFLRRTPSNGEDLEARRVDPLSRSWWEPVVALPRPGVFDRWIPGRSTSPSRALYLGRALITLGQFAAAESVLVETGKRWPAERGVLPLLGVVYYSTGQWENAMQAFSRAVERGERSEVVRSFLGDLYLRSGDDRAALVQFDAGLDDFPDSPALALGRALVLRKQHRLREAVTTLEAVVRKHPDDEAARVQLGALYQELGDYRRAALQYEVLLELRPGNADVHGTLGLIYARALGQDAKALDHLKRSLELDPGGPAAADIRKEIERIERKLPGSERSDQ